MYKVGYTASSLDDRIKDLNRTYIKFRQIQGCGIVCL